MLSLTDRCDYSEIFGVDVANTVRSKLEFIRQEVYNDSRSQKNWLRREYLHREKLDSFMQILHTHDWPVYDYDQLLILNFKSESQCLDYYLKVHPRPNLISIPEYTNDFVCFKKSIDGQDWQDFYNRIKENHWPEYSSLKEFYENADPNIINQVVSVHRVDLYVHQIPERYLVVDGDFLHNTELDQHRYEICVNYFGFKPEVESAKLIHQWYWDCRNRKD